MTQQTMYFTKGRETNSTKLDSVNEINDISNNETEDEHIPIHTDLNDLKLTQMVQISD